MSLYDPALVRMWLDVLYVDTPGLIHISSTGNWTGRAFADPDQAAAYVAEMDSSKPEGIYLRATTMRTQPTAGGRGRIENSHALPGLWADVDLAGPGHKTTGTLPPDVDAGRALIEATGLPQPTLWVHSGGGLYPWWLLADPVDIDDDNIDDIKALSATWQVVIARAAESLGWEYGKGVGDLARVLRVPGTVNRKEGLERPCTIIDVTDHRYTIDDLRSGLAAALERHPAPERPAPPVRSLQVVRAAGDISPGDDFENKVDWADAELLGGDGWALDHEQGGTRYWIRPGKTEGVSATTGRSQDRDRLFVFSENAKPFETWVPYNKFGAYALLHHGGDHSAAAKELRKLGFGTPTPLSPDPSAEQRAAIRDLIPATDGSSALALEPEPADAPHPKEFGPTEDGLARALVAHHGHELRYCPERGSWLRWDCHRWAWDVEEAHREHVLALARQYPDDEKSGFRTFKRRGLSAAGVTGVARLAQSNRRVAVTFDKLDSDPWILNTPQGAVDLRTGKMAPPNPDHLVTRSTRCPSDPGADQTVWLKFLADTFGGDQQLIGYLQRLVGYSAIGLVREHVLPFCFGSGGNGKGVFLEAVAGVLGDYATTAPVGFLMAQQHAGHETEIARLAGARMVICSEVNEADSFDEAKVKQLTGGDTLTARFMRQDHFSFTPTHQLWLMGNHQPAVKSGGRSFWRRLRLVPFEHEVPEDEIVEDLQGILVREHGPAILAWIAQGAADYAAGGLREPETVKAATANYEKNQDTVAQFVEERCRIGGGPAVEIKSAVLWAGYEHWCRANGETAVSRTAFGLAIKKVPGVAQPRSNTARSFAGITLLDADESDENPSPNPSRGGES